MDNRAPIVNNQGMNRLSFGDERTGRTATAIRIRDQILSGVHAPGSRLNEVQIAADLAISRTKLREAFEQLAADGLVQRIVNRGAFVAQIGAQDLLELYEVREGLETMAARLAAERATATQIRQLQELSQLTEAILAAEPSVPYPRHLDIHAAILASAGNARLAQRVREIHLQLALARSRSGYRPARAKRALVEHTDVVSAIADGDPDRAAASMRSHLRASLRHVQALLARDAESGDPKSTEVAQNHGQ